MNGPPFGKREIEKPKPIKIRAANAATRLINLRDAMQTIFGKDSYPQLTEAIDVLQVVAGEKK